MPIRYRCSNCNQVLSISTRMAGRAITCPSCRQEHIVPTPPELAAANPQREMAPIAAPPAKSEQPPDQTDEPAADEVLDDAGLETLPAPSADTGAMFGSLPPGLTQPLVQNPDEVLHPLHDEEEEEGLVIRGAERLRDEMDSIPMVDCVFLILIFYMITASYGLQKTISVPPPDAENKGAVQAAQSVDDLARTSVIVRIDDRNLISIDDEPVGSPDRLVEVLRTKMSGEQKTELVVEAHARALHESVVAVIDAANEVQFQKVRLATTPGSEPD